MKTMISLPAGVAIFAFLALAGLMGLFAFNFNAALPAEAQAKPMEINYQENATHAVTTLSARSDDLRAITAWSLSGEDAGKFSITDGRLSFNDPPDFEDMQDGDPDASPSRTRDNVYKVTVRSTDEDGNVGTLMVEVTVTNVDEPGTVMLSGQQPQVGVTLTATLTDDDGNPTSVTWQWSKSSTENGTYSDIDGKTAATYAPEAGDVGYFLRVAVMYTDPHGPGKSETGMPDYAVRAVPSGTNSPPAFTDEDDGTTGVQAVRNVNENTPAGTPFGKPVAAEEPNPVDRGKLTYSLGGTNATLFDIDSKTGQLMTKGELDQETTATATVLVMATDPSDEPVTLTDATSCDSPINHCAIVTVNITIDNVNEAPEITGGITGGTAKVLYATEDDTNVRGTFTDEDRQTASTTYTAADEDTDDTAGAIELTGPDRGKFTIAGGTLAFAAAPADPPDFENPGDADKDNVYEVTLKSTSTATDTTRALTGTLDVKVMVVNGNDAGEIEFSRPVLRVGIPVTAELKDDDGVTSISSWRWYRGDVTITDGDPPDGTEALGTSATYEPVHADTAGDGLLTVVAKYTDRANGDTEQNAEANTVTTQAVMPYSPGNEPPTFEDEIADTDKVDAEREIQENAAEGTSVGKRLEATDDKPSGDTVFIYTLEGPDADYFKVTTDNPAVDPAVMGGQIQVGKDTKLDYESGKTSYMVTVRAEDSYGESNTIDVTIMVTNDPNEAPTIGPVSDDATLMSLDLWEYPLADPPVEVGDLTGTFMSDDMDYMVDAMNSHESVIVKAVAADMGASVTVNGNAVADNGTAMVDLMVGENTITVVVTAEDETTMMTYTITVDRAAPADPVTRFDRDGDGAISPMEMGEAIDDFLSDNPTLSPADIGAIIDKFLE